MCYSLFGKMELMKKVSFWGGIYTLCVIELIVVTQYVIMTRPSQGLGSLLSNDWFLLELPVQFSLVRNV